MGDDNTLGHPDEVVDTPLPDKKVNKSAFKALQEEYPGDPEDLQETVPEKDTEENG